tara:strand:+ start:347 stop:523 length:177 start_codon:yes stop_codon:yes gene_type:complete
MIIKNAKWCDANERTGLTDTLTATIDGVALVIPKDPANRHYAAIQEWVAEGNKIEDAD